MNSRITKTVALAALVTGVAAGTANAVEGWYGRIDAGYSVDGELDADVGEANFDDDWSQHIGLGYGFDSGFRLEAELSHRFNQLDEADVDTGDVHAYAGMLNLFYDFNKDGWFQPYIGVGVGYGRFLVGYDDAVLGTVNDNDNAFAYQGLIGAAFALTERLDLDVGYRYFTAPELEFDGTTPLGTPASAEADYVHQAVTVGLRWQFSSPAEAPPPPPPPVAAPPPPPVAVCPQSDFVVYFEWDRSNLNQAALEVIDSAVARARECNVSAVAVVGHTDTSGSPTYNQGLSERRASVVRDALVARGLSSGGISTQARGESDLARETRDGVREPLNRRTAVTISFQ